MPPPASPDRILDLCRSYRAACVMAAAVDYDLFAVLAAEPMSAGGLALRLGTDRRATAILLDALAALDLLEKQGDAYRVPPAVAAALTEAGAESVVNMARHQANCLRRWTQLPEVLRTGRPAQPLPSVRGPEADRAAFLQAMHDASRAVAPGLIAEIGPLAFRHLLDVGGATGTWTVEFLRAVPDARATIFDLPDAIPMARERIATAGLTDRVDLVAGDFYLDELPGGVDLAWVSAIVHQNSREQNRGLFARVRRALTPGGAILIRDVVMEDDRTRPVEGALFAINMLVATPGGGTFTFTELREDLEAAGFSRVTLVRRDSAMNSIVRATRP